MKAKHDGESASDDGKILQQIPARPRDGFNGIRCARPWSGGPDRAIFQTGREFVLTAHDRRLVRGTGMVSRFGLATAFLRCGWPEAERSGGRADPWIEKELPSLVKVYQELHRHPELSVSGGEDSGPSRLGAQGGGIRSHDRHRRPWGCTAVLKNSDGPVVLFRSDLNRLPVREETGRAACRSAGDRQEIMAPLPKRSRRCTPAGSGSHITNLIGLSRYAAAHRDRWRGTRWC